MKHYNHHIFLFEILFPRSLPLESVVLTRATINAKMQDVQ